MTPTPYKLTDFIPAAVLFCGIFIFFGSLIFFAKAVNEGDALFQFICTVTGCIGFVMFVYPIWQLFTGELH